MLSRWFLLLPLWLFLLTGCGKPPPPITIAINPWPGYEMLYLAEQKGLFQQVGLNVKLYQLSSLADAQRSYLNGRSDGFTSTLIEAVHANFQGARPLKIIQVPDFSNGGDVIIGRKGMTVADLKGKIVGCEVNSLGIFMLYKALQQVGLTLDDVTVRNKEQLAGYEAMERGEIDAFVAYPPSSVELLKDSRFQVLFSSAEIPGQIIDVISVRASLLEEDPLFQSKMLQVWDLALAYMDQHPDEAYGIMAEREGLSTEDFQSALQDLQIMDSGQQIQLLRESEDLRDNLESVCLILNMINGMDYDCANSKDILAAP